MSVLSKVEFYQLEDLPSDYETGLQHFKSDKVVMLKVTYNRRKAVFPFYYRRGSEGTRISISDFLWDLVSTSDEQVNDPYTYYGSDTELTKEDIDYITSELKKDKRKLLKLFKNDFHVLLQELNEMYM